MIIKRSLRILGGSALALLVSWSVPARAALPVVDVTSLAQLAAQIGSTLSQIDMTKRQVEALHRSARQLHPRNYTGITGLLTRGDLDYATLTRDLSSIRFTVARVNQQFGQIFPNEDSIRNMRASDHEATSRRMNQELHSAALTAARAQSTLTTLEANNTQAKEILSRSEGNESQVTQVQLAIQMLAVMHENMKSIIKTVTTAGRLSSDIAAAAVTERRIRRERLHRLGANYNRSVDYPNIDRRFLR